MQNRQVNDFPHNISDLYAFVYITFKSHINNIVRSSRPQLQLLYRYVITNCRQKTWQPIFQKALRRSVKKVNVRRPLDSFTVWQKDESFASHVQPRKASQFKQEMKRYNGTVKNTMSASKYFAMHVATKGHIWVVAHVVSWLKTSLLAIGEGIKQAIAVRKKEMEGYHCTLAQYKTNLDEALENSAKIMEDGDEHLTLVIADINALFDKEIEALKVKERTDKVIIDEKFDAEVREIEEARRAQLRQVEEGAVRQSELFEKRRRELTDRVTKIAEEYQKNMTELWEQVPAISQTLQTNMDIVEKLLKDDKDLLLKKNEVVRSAKEVIQAYSTNSTARERDSCSVLRVKFHLREKKSVLDGRLNGYYERWEQIDTYEVKERDGTMSMLECLSDNVIVLIKKVHLRRDRYADCLLELDLGSKEVHTVLEHDKPCSILSCSCLGDDTILCHMKDEHFKNKFVIYDRQWQFLKFINPSILDEPRLHNVHTQVDNDGMIIILAIIPGDGKY